MLALALLCTVILLSILPTLPNVSDPETLLASQSIVIADREDRELYRFFQEEDRTSLAAQEIPKHMADAIVAIEDKRFFSRFGCIDGRALLRAALANIGNYKSQGASTITQQLARKAFLSNEKTIDRKVREIILACQLEATLSKEDILSLYLNWTSFGGNIGGVQQAAIRYFGIDAADLTIAQSAILAALPQRPSYFSPYGPHRTELLARAQIVLRSMERQSMLTQKEYAEAAAQLNTVTFLIQRNPIDAPHFVLAIRAFLEDRMLHDDSFNTLSGITVKTTLNSALQLTAQQTVTAHLDDLKTHFGAHNISLVAIDPRSGEILAYVGNGDFFDDLHGGQIDMARRPRQTGSAIKPLIYSMLFEKDYTPNSFIGDTPLDPRIYKPLSSGYYGRMTIRNALGRSRNTPAIRAFYGAGGEDTVLNFFESIGMRSPKERKQHAQETNPQFRYAWSLALGAGEATLLEMVEAYTVLASHGVHRSLTGIKEIVDQKNAVIYTPTQTSKQIISTQSADMITDILSDELAREPLWRTWMHLPGTALKTGTGSICRRRRKDTSCAEVLPNNAWAIGYTDTLLVGVWVGNADNAPLKENSSALDIAVPIWKEFMRRVLSS